MTKEEMTNLIYQTLGNILSATDFRLKKSKEAFVRQIPGGRQMLGPPLLDYNPEFVFSLVMCIRLDAVEEIFHLFSGSPNAKYQAMSYTTITRLEYFTGGPTDFKVATADDVTSAGTVLSSVIREKIIPFFDEHKDVSALDTAVNWQEPGIDITQNPSGAMHSIILAHLAGSQNFDALVAKHRSEMQLGREVVHPFNRLVEYLKTQ